MWNLGLVAGPLSMVLHEDSQLCRRNVPEQDAALTESLLHSEGADVEAAANPNAPQKRKRPWTSLLGTALVYVWPHDRMLQVLTIPAY